MCKLVFRAYEIELEMFVVSAAFQTLTCFSLVCDEAVKTGPQKRLEARFARVVVGEMVLLKRIREEALRQVFRILVVGLPLEPHVFVNRLPVTRENCFERALPHELVAAARAHNRRLVGHRKVMLRAADVCVWI